ncbi:MAG: hypothetical protein AAFZ91_00450 [Pseudomonadota bacterium]
MKWIELVLDAFLAVLFYGVLATIVSFIGLLFWGAFEFDVVLKMTVIIGSLSAVLGAAIPATRTFAASVLTFITPIGW